MPVVKPPIFKPLLSEFPFFSSGECLQNHHPCLLCPLSPALPSSSLYSDLAGVLMLLQSHGCPWPLYCQAQGTHSRLISLSQCTGTHPAKHSGLLKMFSYRAWKQMNTSQMRTSSLSRARASEGVSPHRLGLAETKRQMGIWGNFLVEQKEGSG